MVVIWGSNYSIVKSALTDIPPVAFNGLRLTIASAIFLVVLAWRSSRAPKSSKRPLLRSTNLWILALVGHTAYQVLFIEALALTSAANSALIIGCTPIFVALLSAALGHERVPPRRWAGIALSAAGIYLVVGRGAGASGDSLTGDLMMIVAVLCWSAATIVARPLLARESPLVVTGYSMALGTVCYWPLAWTAMRGVTWSRVPVHAWLALFFSALFALCVAYIIWYTALQRLGSTRTAIYSNMVPVAAMVVAFLAFAEPMGAVKIAGAAAVLAGVASTRL